MAQARADRARAAQATVAAAVTAGLDQAWSRVDLADLPGSMPKLFALVAALVHRYSPAAAALAGQYYTDARVAARLSAPTRVVPAEAPPMSQIGATVGWATEPLRQDQADVELAKTRLDGSINRLVLNVGRQTLVDAVQADRKARGWARVTRPGACYFCRLMATRGAVYKSQGRAGRDANSRFVGEGEFKWHNHCHCYIEPVFGQYEMTAQARSDLVLYKRVATGKSGADARNAFRAAVTSQ